MIRLRRTELEKGRGVPDLVPRDKYLMVKVGDGFLKGEIIDYDGIHGNPITKRASLACVFYPKKKNDQWPGYKYTRKDAEKMAAHYGGELVWVSFVLEPFVYTKDKEKTDAPVILRVGESLFSTGVRKFPFTNDFRRATRYRGRDNTKQIPPLHSLKNALRDQEEYGGQLFRLLTKVSEFPY